MNVGKKSDNEIGRWWIQSGRLLEVSEGQMAEVMCRQMLVMKQDMGLDRDEIQIMEELIGNLGYYDVSMQEKGLAYCVKRLEELIERTEQTAREKKKLYQTLGILGGCFLVIMLL